MSYSSFADGGYISISKIHRSHINKGLVGGDLAGSGR